jgi:hypothetical protein
MCKLLIHQYNSYPDMVLQYGKSRNEQTILITFIKLLNEYAAKLNYGVIVD